MLCRISIRLLLQITSVLLVILDVYVMNYYVVGDHIR